MLAHTQERGQICMTRGDRTHCQPAEKKPKKLEEYLIRFAESAIYLRGGRVSSNLKKHMLLSFGELLF